VTAVRTPPTSTTVRGACPHDCPDTCAMLVTVEDGVAVKVQGDPEHPYTNGGLCVKVSHYGLHAQIGKSRAHAIGVIALDIGPRLRQERPRARAPATVAIDPYHVVALGNRALDDVCRGYRNELRRGGRPRRRAALHGCALVTAQSARDPQRRAGRHAPWLRRGGEVWRAPTRSKKHSGRSSPPGLTLYDVTNLDRPVHQQGRP